MRVYDHASTIRNFEVALGHAPKVGRSDDARLYRSIMAAATSRYAEVAELADAPDSKSGAPRGACGFDSHLRHFPLVKPVAAL
jgi:hypothetical protein